MEETEGGSLRRRAPSNMSARGQHRVCELATGGVVTLRGAGWRAEATGGVRSVCRPHQWTTSRH